MATFNLTMISNMFKEHYGPVFQPTQAELNCKAIKERLGIK